MGYKVIFTDTAKQSAKDSLNTLGEVFHKQLEKFTEIFNQDPFEKTLSTHSIEKAKDQQIILYSSYINKKIRLLRLLIKPNTILVYKILTDHDYHKVQKAKKAILKLGQAFL